MRFGSKLNPDANTVNAYNGMMLLALALKRGNGTGAAVMAALESGKIEGPNGPLTIVHRYAAQAVYIGEAVGDGAIATLDSTPPIQPAVNCK